MREQILVLEQSIREDLTVIDRLFAVLAEADLDGATPQKELIVVGYRLHNLYNAFENIFRMVAGAFENALDERSGWHAEILRRMRLDLMPIRPSVIDAEAFDRLDELRRFRHLFRSLYTGELDALRMTLAFEKALELREIWPPQIEAFLAFLESLRGGSPETS